MTIRLATMQDLEQLLAHRLSFIRTLKQGDSTQQPSPGLLTLLSHLEGPTSQYLEAHLENGTFLAFIAEENNEIISSCFVCLSEQLPTLKNSSCKEGLILNVYTLPSYRKQGLATLLLQEVFKYATTHQIGALRLSATESGFPLYKKLGFTLQERDMLWTPSCCSLH